jgi:hypothetical protein
MKFATNVTITTPPFCGNFCKISSGTLRGTLQTARADECEKITGACATRNASLIVLGAACERSTSMPSRFISRTIFAERRQTFVTRLQRRSSIRPIEMGVVGECHIAHAEVGNRRGARRSNSSP